jgi:hypothetical protein
MKNISMKLKRLFFLYVVRRSCYDIKIPNWCIGDAINSYKYTITKEKQKKVRDWYLKNLPEKCETITDFKSNWIGKSFGTQYYSGSSKQWGGFILCVGENVYVKLC